MDQVDRQILAELQADGRLTVTELAERVRLSVSPCHRRLRALERSGAISGYSARLDAAALGLTFEAIVFVTMRTADRETVNAFERAAAAIPHVQQAQRLFGDPDYLLHVIATDLPAFQRLYDEQLGALPGIQRLSSTLVMKNVVDHRPCPCDPVNCLQRGPRFNAAKCSARQGSVLLGGEGVRLSRRVRRGEPPRILIYRCSRIQASLGDRWFDRFTPLIQQAEREIAQELAELGRQVDVLRQVSRGLSNNNVAEALGLLPNTVKTYLKTAMRKLRATNRVHATVLARDAGLIP